MTRVIIDKKIEERFWAKVKKTDDCWEWMACKEPDGSGRIGIDNKTVIAHRLSWELTYGSIPDCLMVIHTCGNKSCVRPDHLSLGTYDDIHEKIPLEKRFWEKVQKTLDGCWNWCGAKSTAGYGYLRIEKHGVLAHRIAWELTHRDIPEGMCVLHHCDNPACVNPDHLFLGNQQDNTQDMIAKGRERWAWTDLNKVKTHCPYGHPYSGENLYIAPNGGRQCRTCRRERDRLSNRRRADG